MKLDKTINYNRIEIWAPRYHDAADGGSYIVLIAPWKVGEHNIIYFTKARHLDGKEYYMSGDKVRSYPEDSNDKAKMYAVPLNDLQLITSDIDEAWDKMVDEYDNLEERVNGGKKVQG